MLSLLSAPNWRPSAIPGLAQAGHNLYSLAGAQALSATRAKFQRGRIVLLVSAVPFKCPAAPYEAAMLLEYDCRRAACAPTCQ